MSSAGIYRYYASRDELALALIRMGFDSLGEALRSGIEEIADGAAKERLGAAMRRYRWWASTQPHLFSLVFTDPIPGFVAPPDGPSDAAVRSALAPVVDLCVDVSGGLAASGLG